MTNTCQNRGNRSEHGMRRRNSTTFSASCMSNSAVFLIRGFAPIFWPVLCSGNLKGTGLHCISRRLVAKCLQDPLSVQRKSMYQLLCSILLLSRSRDLLHQLTHRSSVQNLCLHPHELKQQLTGVCRLLWTSCSREGKQLMLSITCVFLGKELPKWRTGLLHLHHLWIGHLPYYLCTWPHERSLRWKHSYQN